MDDGQNVSQNKKLCCPVSFILHSFLALVRTSSLNQMPKCNFVSLLLHHGSQAVRQRERQ